MAHLRTPSSTTVPLPFFVRFRHGFVNPWPSALVLAAVLLGATAADADTLRGRVVDPDGRAVSGAHVTVSGATAAPIAVVTDAAGSFSWTICRPGPASR